MVNDEQLNKSYMQNFIPITRPWITEGDIQAVTDVLRTGMLVQGAKVAELEYQVSKYLGTKEAVAVSSGTATLHLILKAYGISKGDEVIVPAFSFVATANVVELVGAKPVFVDINIETLNIDVAQIEEKITDRTKAIIPVHEFGLASDAKAVMQLCKKHDLLLIEDAACALGAGLEQKKTGTLGNAASFSFHPRKAITSGEGGMIVTDDSDLAEKCRILRNHGIDSNKGKTGFVEAGFNYRMTDFQAALLLSQLPRLEEIMSAKDKIVERYLNEIVHPSIELPVIPKGYRHSWQSFHIIVNHLSQTEAVEKLRKSGIGANYGAQCIPEVDFYKNKYGFEPEKEFPNAHKAFHKGLVIPLYPQMTSEEITHVIQSINSL